MNKTQTSTPHFELVIEGIYKFVNDVLNSDNAEQKKKLCETIHEVAKLLHCPKTDESKILQNDTFANILEMKTSNNEGEQETIEYQSEKKNQLDSHDDLRLKLLAEISNGNKIPVLKIKKINVDYSIKSNSKSRKRSNENDKFQIEKKSKLEQIKKIELPNEIWLKIMNYLGTKDVFMNFRLVCKNFDALTSDVSCFEYSANNYLTHEGRKSQYQSALKQLRKFNRLKEIRISESERMRPMMVQAVKLHKNIKSLKLSNIGGMNLKFSNDSLNQIHTLKRLEHLELRDIAIAPYVVDYIASSFRTIKSFIAIESTKDKTSNFTTPGNVQSFVTFCKNLEAISFCIYFEPRKKEYDHKSMKGALDKFFLEKRKP